MARTKTGRGLGGEQEEQPRDEKMEVVEIMAHRSSRKRSTHNLKLLIERAVSDECGLRRGLWFCVENVETAAYPFERITVWSTLHFTADGSPFCCGEPTCHLRQFASDNSDRISDHIRRAMGLDQKVVVEIFKHMRPVYHPGVEFKLPKQVWDE